MAVREGKEDAVESLLANKATVSIKDNDGVSMTGNMIYVVY